MHKLVAMGDIFLLCAMYTPPMKNVKCDELTSAILDEASPGNKVVSSLNFSH